MSLHIEGFFDPDTYTVSYIVADTGTSRCAIIDPVLDYEPHSGRTGTASAEQLIARVREAGWTLDWILETHAHADHLSGAQHVRKALGGKIAIGEHITTVQKAFGKLFDMGAHFAADGSQFDHLFRDGERFHIGAIEARVMHTPGHTPACVSYVIGDACFVGDTLFMPDYGTARADFPGGDARTLYRSIQKILALPDSTRLFMCHDYLPGGREVRWETTVAEQKAGNIMLAGIDEANYVREREARDAKLAAPRLILPSLQVNITAGALPDAAGNGIRYLKIPLDQLGGSRSTD